MKILIRNGKLINGSKIEVLIENDSILDIGQSLKCQADRCIDLEEDTYLSAGWIDIHTHAFKHFKLYSDDPDEIGYKTGVTCVVDAGTTGADDIDRFYQDSLKSKTRVYALINIAHQGILEQNELSDLNDIQFEMIKKALLKYPNFILGLKARMSASVVGQQGIEPLVLAKKYSRALNLPLMVHIGSTPPDLDQIAQHLDKGDIITHIFNGKDNGIYEGNNIKQSIIDAGKRGVYFDLGHGKESFSFSIARQAYKDGFLCDSISSDIYSRNRLEGPVYSLVTTMNKMLYLGYSLEKVINSVTELPREIFKFKDMGRLEIGSKADLTFFKYDIINENLVDSLGQVNVLEKGLKVSGVLLKGDYYEIK